MTSGGGSQKFSFQLNAINFNWNNSNDNTELQTQEDASLEPKESWKGQEESLGAMWWGINKSWTATLLKKHWELIWNEKHDFIGVESTLFH